MYIKCHQDTHFPSMMALWINDFQYILSPQDLKTESAFLIESICLILIIHFSCCLQLFLPLLSFLLTKRWLPHVIRFFVVERQNLINSTLSFWQSSLSLKLSSCATFQTNQFSSCQLSSSSNLHSNGEYYGRNYLDLGYHWEFLS